MEAALNSSLGHTILGPTIMTIGRTSDNQLVVSDPKASSHHAEIRAEGQGYTITDLGSTNGTFVNEQRLTPDVPCSLNAGDAIRIGDTKFTYEVSGVAQDGATVLDSSGEEQQSTIAASRAQAYGSDAQQGYQWTSSQAYSAYPPPQQSYMPPPQPTYQSYSSPEQFYTPPVPPQKKSRRGLWIMLSIIGVVLLVGLTAGGILFFLNLPSPAKTLDAYCNALRNGDTQTAYNQFSSKYQNKTPSSEIVFKNKVTSCTYSSPDTSGDNATSTVTLGYEGGGTSGDSATLIQDGSNGWRIDDPGLSTPTKTLDTFCTALQGADTQTAYNQFSSAFQSKVPVSQFVFKNKVTSCKQDSLNVSPGSATANLTLNYSSGGTTSGPIKLIQDNNNNWKIDDDPSLSTPTKTLDTFCSALLSGDAQTSYNQFSSSLQSGLTEDAWATAVAADPFTQCTHGVPTMTGTGASATLVISHPDGTTKNDVTTLIQDNNNAWKIDTIVSQ